MIEFLEGTLVEKSSTHCVLQSSGVAFFLPVSLSSIEKLPKAGSSVRLFTHLAVREDDLTLYGFASGEERQLFRQLIQVSGIGPKLALTVLSGLQASQLRQAVQDGDIRRLSSISGIGKKTAERMVLELRDRFAKEPGLFDPALPPEAKPQEDAVQALMALGFKEADARKRVSRGAKSAPSASVEELVRQALSS